MIKRDVIASEAHSRQLGRVYQQQHVNLRLYFMRQLGGDEAEADECVSETFRHLSLFMEDRRWESEENLQVYVMRIAGSVCSKRLAGKRARRSSWLGDWNPFRRVGARLIRAIEGRTHLMKTLQGLKQRSPRGKGTK